MQEQEFVVWLKQKYEKASSWQTYLAEVRRVERHKGDLDQLYADDRFETLLGLFEFSKAQGIMPKDDIPHRADPYNTASFRRRSVMLYKEFLEATEHTASDEFKSKPVSDIPGASSLASSSIRADNSFSLERDLQSTLRTEIEALESGLRVVDGGGEYATEVGNIDILARDSSGRLVVIELKAHTAGPDAINQILAYMGAIREEVGEQDVRGIIVARDFHRRTVSGASVSDRLTLKRYALNVTFEDFPNPG